VHPGAGDPLVDAFHRGVYWDEFADQHEPLSVWHAALRGELAYELAITLVLDSDIVGGICAERYPRSGCGFLTYMVIAPHARGTGLGKQLQLAAVRDLHARGAPLVLGEINDPRITTLEPPADAWNRLERNIRWGARVLGMRYIQPALGPGLSRDRQLLLIALAGDAALPDQIDGSIVRAFVDELYSITENSPPDDAIVIPDKIPLLTQL